MFVFEKNTKKNRHAKKNFANYKIVLCNYEKCRRDCKGICLTRSSAAEGDVGSSKQLPLIVIQLKSSLKIPIIEQRKTLLKADKELDH